MIHAILQRNLPKYIFRWNWMKNRRQRANTTTIENAKLIGYETLSLVLCDISVGQECPFHVCIPHGQKPDIRSLL